MTADRQETLLIAGLLAVTLVFGFGLLPMGIALGYGSDGTGLSPRFMPELATLGIALALVVGLLRSVFAANASAEVQEEGSRHPLRVLGAVAICMLFALFGFRLAGFYLGGVVMVMLLTLLLGERKARSIFLLPLLVVATIYLVFEFGLQVRLPKSGLFSGVPL